MFPFFHTIGLDLEKIGSSIKDQFLDRFKKFFTVLLSFSEIYIPICSNDTIIYRSVSFNLRWQGGTHQHKPLGDKVSPFNTI